MLEHNPFGLNRTARAIYCFSRDLAPSRFPLQRIAPALLDRIIDRPNPARFEKFPKLDGFILRQAVRCVCERGGVSVQPDIDPVSRPVRDLGAGFRGHMVGLADVDTGADRMPEQRVQRRAM